MFNYWVSYPVVLIRQTCTILCMAKPSNKCAVDDFLVVLSNAIRHKRAEIRLSQEALAVDAELDRSYVGGIEGGENNLTVMNAKN